MIATSLQNQELSEPKTRLRRLLDLMALSFQRISTMAAVRLARAQSAYSSELAWQQALRKFTPTNRALETKTVSGFLLQSGNRSLIPLAEGVNSFGNITIRLEKGCAEYRSGHNSSKDLFANDFIELPEGTFQIKVFPMNRSAQIVQYQTRRDNT